MTVDIITKGVKWLAKWDVLWGSLLITGLTFGLAEWLVRSA